jgi:hypothetical protein
MATLSPGGFLARWLGALALVLGTFNPTEYSFVRWIMEEPREEMLPLKLLVGAVILIGFVMYFRATYESIGIIGVALAVLFFGAIVWLLLDNGWLDPDEPQTFVWVVLIVLATIMAIGMSWSILRRRLTGQVDQV